VLHAFTTVHLCAIETPIIKCFRFFISLYIYIYIIFSIDIKQVMNKEILVEFVELKKSISVELDNSQSPETVKAILDNLPIKVKINRWGDELYTDKTPIIAEEENAQSEVSLLDVAYWPDGNALCLFYGPTPITKKGENKKILPYSPVNIVGKIVSKDDILNQMNDSNSTVIVKPK
jgi:uncharacterized protein